MESQTSQWEGQPPKPPDMGKSIPPIGGLKIRIVLKSTRWVAEKEE
jgi:hypothetical protein